MPNPVLGADGAKAPTIKAGLYCLNHHPGLEVFAGKLLPSGDMAVGFSNWYPNGHHIGFFGTAARKGNHWEYVNHMDASDPADRCKVYIRSGPDGVPFIVGDRTAKCQTQGGIGTEMGPVEFPPSAYEGPVTTELADSEIFFNSGKCAR